MDENIDLKNFPVSDSAKRMLSYVSDGFYEKSYVGKWLFQVMGDEYDYARKLVLELPYQFFPETATWGLMYHELKWGLPVRENLPIEQRRLLIYQKRDLKAPMTPYKMEAYLAQATGFCVRVADVNDPGRFGFVPQHPNIFKVYFTGEGTLDSRAVHQMINRMKQSHTAYTVNDRVVFTADNRDIEEIILKRMRLYMKANFWGCYLFDGSYRFDGAITFGRKRRYGMKQYVRCQTGVYCGNEKMALPCIQVVAACQENGNIRTNTRCSMLIRNQITARKASVVLRMQMESFVERIGQAEVIVKRGPYFFDGAVKFNGSVQANSIYRKEVLE